MTFQLGQEVWYVHLESIEKWLPCPDCFGKKHITMILGDGSQVSIDCAGCQLGYDPPRGTVRVYQYLPKAQFGKVTGVNCDRWNKDCATVEYQVRGSYDYHLQDSDVFLTKPEAEKRAEEKAREMSVQAMEQFYKRERQNHTWAWNVTYHRRQLKEAQRNIEYHSAKLAVALEHKKEEKIA